MMSAALVQTVSSARNISARSRGTGPVGSMIRAQRLDFTVPAMAMTPPTATSATPNASD